MMSNITGWHPYQTGSLIGVLPLCNGAIDILYSSSQQGEETAQVFKVKKSENWHLNQKVNELVGRTSR